MWSIQMTETQKIKFIFFFFWKWLLFLSRIYRVTVDWLHCHNLIKDPNISKNWKYVCSKQTELEKKSKRLEKRKVHSYCRHVKQRLLSDLLPWLSKFHLSLFILWLVTRRINTFMMARITEENVNKNFVRLEWRGLRKSVTVSGGRRIIWKPATQTSAQIWSTQRSPWWQGI